VRRRRAASTRRSEAGASAVEYGLLVALIASVVVVAVFSLGQVVSAVFLQTCKQVVTNNSAAASGSCTP